MAQRQRGWLRAVIAGMLGVTGWGAVRAATPVSGTVWDGNGGPWTLAGSPYLVTGDVTVPAGKGLTVQPGVIVKFVYGTVDLIVDGTLSAAGTPSERIVFTSDRDDTAGGDTNGDGNASGPYAGIWGCLRFTATGTGSVLDQVEVRYAGWDSGGGVWVDGGPLTLTNSLITTTAGTGLRIRASNPVLTGNTFTNNGGAAISMALDSNPDIRGVTLNGNGTNGLVLDSGTLAAGGLAWDDPDIVYVLFDDITVPVGATLSIAAGQVVKLGYGTVDLLVNGTLLAAGTAGARIELTSYRDDDVGGNTNGTADGPWRGIWGGVKFGSTSAGNSLQHCRFSYGGWDSPGEVVVDRAGVSMADCTVRQCSGNGVRIVGANPGLQRTTFADDAGSAVSMDLASDPDIDGVTVTNNGVNGLTLDTGTLSGNGAWDDPDITYRLAGDVTVPAGSTLTVAPGQVVKVAYGTNELRVEGTLLADGSADAAIVFTSERDDSVGGDTNNNGANDGPYAGIWDGLRFDSGSTGSLLDGVDVRYGGWSNPATIWVNGGQLSLTDSTVYGGSRDGLRVVDSTPTLLDNRFESNAWSALSMNLASDPDIRGVVLVNNGVNGLTLDAGELPGDGAWDDPDITYRLAGDVTVPAGLVLTVAPGQVVKVAYGTNDLIVRGTLLAAGTVEAPIVFTSDRDDSVGGDTNNNGGGDGPWAGIWGRLRFEASSTDSVLTHVGVFYPGWNGVAGIEVSGASLTMTDCTIYGAPTHGLRLDDCAPEIRETRFDHNAWAAISMDLDSAPVIAGVTLESNGQNGLRLDSGVLPGSAVWDDTDIVHILSGDTTVPAGATLALSPGLIVKAQYGTIRLLVDGTLSAAGTAAAPIIFTTDRDDSVGGDTDNSPTGPYRGLWGGLSFGSTSADSVLDHVAVRYAGWGLDAAVFVDACPLTVRNAFISQCATSGIGARRSAGIDLENVVAADNNHSGVFAFSGSVAALVNCTLDHNATGLHTDAATALVTNSLVTRNSSSGLYRAGDSAITVRSSDVYNPGAGYGNYRDMASQTGLNGNLSADPQYTGDGTLPYQLQNGSPAIDAGTSQDAPRRDYLGLLRYDHPDVPNAEPGLHGGVDLGAFEYNGLEPLDFDLTVTAVVGPATGPQNGTVQVTWEVTSTGSAAADGSWYDAVYLSTDGTLSDDDRLMGSLQHLGGLAAGDTYGAALDILLQGVAPGSFHFLVVADVRQETREGGPQTNNAAPAVAATVFTMPQLTLGVPTAGTFAVVGDRQFYQVLVPTGANLLLRLDDADDAGLNELYLSRGLPPTAASAQYAANGGADHTMSVPAAPAGVWYVQVYNAAGTGAYTLLVETARLAVHDVSPAALGSNADMVLTLTGAGFTAGVQVDLVAGTGTAYPGTVTVDSYSRLTASFGADSVPAGLYTVRARTPTGDDVEVPDAFTVLAGGEASLDARVVVPSALGYHQVATLYVEYTNTGTLSMQAPLLILTAEQNGRQAALMTLDSSRLSDGFWTSAVPEGFSHSVALLASGETPGILQPGESGRVPVYWAGWLQPWDFAYPPFEFKVYTLGDATRQAIDWAAIKEPCRPPEIEPAAWDVVFAAFTAKVGATYVDYVRTLNANAADLARHGVVENDIGRLLGRELLKAYGQNPVALLAGALDAMLRGNGIPLMLQRFYPQGIPQRHRLGPFGRGWTHSWDKTQSVRSDGSVVLTCFGSNYVFQPDSRGGFLAPQGYAARLVVRGSNYDLTERETGVTYRFSGGLLVAVSDADGNRVDLAYSGDRLTSLRNAAGQTVTLSYNAQGRISQVADSDGNSSTYGYDGSGEFLTGVTDPWGRTTAYTYATASATASYRALTAITFPDGTAQTFSYDADGRLAGTDLGGAGNAAFTYAADGSVTMVNDRGATGRFSIDANGRFLKAEQPAAILPSYDANGRVTALTTSDGARHELRYDSRGNLTRWTDPLGATRVFSYDGHGGVTRFTDPNGHSTSYTRNAAGNLLSVTYANGASESYWHDAAGNVTGHTNARGQAQYFSYTGNGRVSTQVNPGGLAFTYSYNARGQVTGATGPAGTTVVTYDANQRVAAIVHPDGKSLAYTYDALGRRVTMQDHQGHLVRYAYDALGRIAEISDGPGNRLAAYTYGPGSVLTRKDLGNGARVEYSYDAWGRPVMVTNRAPDSAVLSSYAYAYDDLGQVSTMQTDTGTWSYTYDAAGRLVRAVHAPAGAGAVKDITYAYDPGGNRVAMTEDGVVTPYAVNAMGQYTAAGATSLGYDADGNLTSMASGGEAWTYQYDAANRLISAHHGTDTWTYEYDAFGFRSAVTRNGERSTFLYDPTGLGDLVAEFDAAGALRRRHVHLAGAVASFDGAGNATYPLADAGGNVTALIDASGTPVSTYAYAPFGESMGATEAVETPFRFSGDLGAVTDETGLVFMRNRYYSPALGRFLSADPPRDTVDNRYAYADNAPTLLVDPLGLEPHFQHTPETIKRHLREIIEYERRHGTAATLAEFNPTWLGEHNGHFFKTIIPTNCGEVDMDWFLTMAHFCTVGRNVGVASGAVVGGIGGVVAGGVAGPGGSIIAGGKGAAVGAAAGAAVTSPTWVYWPAKIFWSFKDWDDKWAHLKAIGNQQELVAMGMANMIHAGYSIEAVFATYGIPTGARDPNAKSGPQGVGAAAWVSSVQTLPYRIDFENDAAAGAPAQYVTIRDALSSSFDWSSVELTEVGFGDQVLPIPPGRQSYSTTVPMTSQEVDFEVHVQVVLDPATGQLQADFFSIDPASGLPPPVEIGFLPPEDGTGRGKGYVAYVVRPHSGLASGTEIRNVAVITFDFGEVIATNQRDPHDPGAGTDPAKEALVTIDDQAPTSAVTALPALSPAGFMVSWSGTDAGSGLAAYTIYVSQDGGPFSVWLSATAQTAAAYPGVAGHTYGFYCLATDAAGHVEATKVLAEATIAVAALPTDPEGDFETKIGLEDVAVGRGWWNLSGVYPPPAEGPPLGLVLVHDATGTLSGIATYTVGAGTAVTVPLRGTVKGTAGSIVVKCTMRGTGASGSVSLALRLTLTLDTVTRQLTGRLTGSVRSGGVSTPVDDPVVFGVPGDMDGTWSLRFELEQTGRTVTGKAVLTLSNQVTHSFAVKGRANADDTAVLNLSGGALDPSARSLKIRTTITPLAGGTARIEGLSGRGYGQTLGW